MPETCYFVRVIQPDPDTLEASWETIDPLQTLEGILRESPGVEEIRFVLVSESKPEPSESPRCRSKQTRTPADFGGDAP